MNKNFSKINVAKWNDDMYKKHPTPYSGIAGVVEIYRIRKIIKYSDIKPEDKVLEIGCESGNLLASLQKSKQLVGFDISNKALKDADKFLSSKNIDYKLVQGDATKKLPFNKGEFDVIVCSETLEHVTKPDKVIKNIFDISNNNTRIIITVPNEKPKLFIKEFLVRFGLMKLLFPDIETEKSEWHIHSFSKDLLFSYTKEYFKTIRTGSIFGLHL